MFLLSRLVSLALWVFELALIAYVAVRLLRLPDNRWIELLNRYLEPVLIPIRSTLNRILPDRFRSFDWSPVAAWLLVEFAAFMLNRLFGILA